MTLFGKRIFTDVIKNLEMKKSSWITRADLKFIDKYPYKKQKKQDTDTQRRWCKDSGRDWSDAAIR